VNDGTECGYRSTARRDDDLVAGHDPKLDDPGSAHLASASRQRCRCCLTSGTPLRTYQPSGRPLSGLDYSGDSSPWDHRFRSQERHKPCRVCHTFATSICQLQGRPSAATFRAYGRATWQSCSISRARSVSSTERAGLRHVAASTWSRWSKTDSARSPCLAITARRTAKACRQTFSSRLASTRRRTPHASHGHRP
jgi:hypothetical protein